MSSPSGVGSIFSINLEAAFMSSSGNGIKGEQAKEGGRIEMRCGVVKKLNDVSSRSHRANGKDSWNALAAESCEWWKKD